MHKNICFLTYLNRSGSTLLSKELSESLNVFVSIEAQWVNRLMKDYCLPMGTSEFEKFKFDLFSETKFKNWNIPTSSLEKEFDKLEFPVGINDVIDVIAELSTKDQEVDFFVLKCGKHYRYYQQLKELYPESKFLFVRRDPRGIFNSLAKSVDSRSGEIMQSDLVKFCLAFKRAQDIVRELSTDQDFMIVDYKDLVLQKQEVIESIGYFLNTNKITRFVRYSERVPREQKHLHQNLNQPMLIERLEAWKSELSQFEILAIQRLLHSEIVEARLEFEKVPQNVITTCMSSWILLRFRLRAIARKLMGRFR